MRGSEVILWCSIALILSICLFLLSAFKILPGVGVFDSFFLPFATYFSQVVHSSKAPQQKLQEVHLDVIQKNIDTKHLEEDNKALRDQFATAETRSLLLLPSHIIGAPQFLPGVGQPESLILDQGESTGVKKGQAVIFKNAAVGLVSLVHAHTSLVKLVSSSGISFPAKTTETNALGILKGLGSGDMVFDNVVLSDELKKGDVLESNMSEESDTTGYPPGLTIGKIESVEKNPSSLFQRAQVKSLVDVTAVSIVFVVIGDK